MQKCHIPILLQLLKIHLTISGCRCLRYRLLLISPDRQWQNSTTPSITMRQRPRGSGWTSGERRAASARDEWLSCGESLAVEWGVTGSALITGRRDLPSRPISPHETGDRAPIGRRPQKLTRAVWHPLCGRRACLITAEDEIDKNLTCSFFVVSIHGFGVKSRWKKFPVS